MASASALEMPSFTGLGAPSTRSFASLRPRLVTSRTALITFTLLSPIAVSITVNSVFSSAGAAAAAPPAAGPATTVAAAAETPNFSSMSLMSCESSRTVILLISSRICVRSIVFSNRFLITQFGLGSSLFLRIAIGGERAHELAGHLVHGANELRHGRLHRAHELRHQPFRRGRQ